LPTQAETFDQTLDKCQYYYEKSYDQSVLAGTVSALSQLTFNQGVAISGGNYLGFSESFGIIYKTVKRAIPTTTLYSPSAGTINAVDSYLYEHGAISTSSPLNWSTYWASTSAGTKGATFDTAADSTWLTHASPGGNQNMYSTIKLQYTSDARLGL
jgi:hypothetical protein